MPHLYPRYIPTISLRPHLSLLSHYFLSASIVGLFSATLSFSFSAPQLTEPLFLFSSTSFLSHSSLLSLPLPLSLSPPTIFSLHALLLFSSPPLFPLYHLPPLFFNRPPPPLSLQLRHSFPLCFSMHVSPTIFFYSICPPALSFSHYLTLYTSLSLPHSQLYFPLPYFTHSLIVSLPLFSVTAFLLTLSSFTFSTHFLFNNMYTTKRMINCL